MAAKEYLCKKCKTLHAPPTGRKCQNVMVEHSDNMDTVMDMLQNITDRLTVIETKGVVNAEEDPESDIEIEEAPEAATSKTPRNDATLDKMVKGGGGGGGWRGTVFSLDKQYVTEIIL